MLGILSRSPGLTAFLAFYLAVVLIGVIYAILTKNWRDSVPERPQGVTIPGKRRRLRRMPGGGPPFARFRLRRGRRDRGPDWWGDET